MANLKVTKWDNSELVEMYDELHSDLERLAGAISQDDQLAALGIAKRVLAEMRESIDQIEERIDHDGNKVLKATADKVLPERRGGRVPESREI